MKTKSVKVDNDSAPCVALILTREEAAIIIAGYGVANATRLKEGLATLYGALPVPPPVNKIMASGDFYLKLVTALRETY